MAPSRQRIVVAGLLYFGVGLWVASFFGTWADEEYTLATTSQGVAYAIHRAITYELQAPLYFAIMALWREISPSIWFARLFSLLCATGLFFAFVKIGERVEPRRDPLGFALLAALNPFVVVAAFQIRLYALALLLSALLWLCFDYGFANGKSTRARIGFVAIAILGVYVQYFLGFMLIGFGVALLVRRERNVLLAYLSYASVVAVASIPLAIIARSQVAGYALAPVSRFSLAYLTGLHPWLEFLIPHLYTMRETRLEHIAYLAVALVVAICWAYSRPNVTRKLFSTLTIAIAIELVFVAVALVLDERLNDRYFIALFVPAVVAVYAFLRSSTAIPPLPQRVLVGIFTVMTFASLISQYRFLAQNGDWIRVGAYMQAHAQPGDLIVLYTSDNLPAFLRQYHGDVRVVPFPRPQSQEKYTLEALQVDSPQQATAVFNGLGPYRKLWLIDTVQCKKEAPEYGCVDFETALHRDFDVAGSASFYMNSVRELRRRGGSAAKVQ